MRKGLSQRTLPQALYDAGLAPADVIRPTCPPVVVWRHLPADGPLLSRYVDWEPDRRIEDCWYLVERYELALIPDSDRTWAVLSTWPEPPVQVLPSQHARRVPFADLPAAICRVALARWQAHQEDPAQEGDK